MNEIPQSITAPQLVSLLEAKHSKDLCVAECKDGPTQFGPGCLRMDFWTMPRSWAKPWVSAYEIKISRGDFMRDDKWPGYLQHCNMFSFVCPAGLIQPEELPEGVGLYWASKNGARLYCKRKPANRTDVQIPENLYRYILMCRVRITREMLSTEDEPMDRPELEKWLKDENSADQNVGRRLSLAIARRVKAQVGEVMKENEQIKTENARLLGEQEPLQNLKLALAEIGITHFSSWKPLVEQIRDQLGMSSWMATSLEGLQRDIGKLLDHHRDAKGKGA